MMGDSKNVKKGTVPNFTYPMVFEANLHTVVWGGDRLCRWKGLPAQEHVGESWEVSAVESSPSVVANGPLYCMPCTVGIEINNCNRMSLMLRRAPSASWLNEHWQAEMKKIEGCLHCGRCVSKCPYHLNTPELLRKNYEDYQRVLRGEVKV